MSAVTRRYAAAATAAGALVLGLAGCTGEEPGPETSSTTPPVTASPSPSSTTAAPTTSTPTGPAGYPEAAREQSEAGGAAFVEYYFSTLNMVYQDPKVGVIDALSATECVFCASQKKQIRDLVDGGGRYESQLVELAPLRPIGSPPAGQRYYNTTSAQLDAWILDRNGKRFQQAKKSALPVTFVTVWEDGHWLLLEGEKS